MDIEKIYTFDKKSLELILLNCKFFPEKGEELEKLTQEALTNVERILIINAEMVKTRIIAKNFTGPKKEGETYRQFSSRVEKLGKKVKDVIEITKKFDKQEKITKLSTNNLANFTGKMAKSV